jgi:alpha-galactosidase
MSIHVQDNIFLIQTQRMSYAFGIGAGGKLIHLYWGDKLPNANGLQRLLQQTQKTMFSNYELPLEYRGQEPFDYFQPAILPVFSDQGRGARLAVTNHKLDDNSLTVTLKDINYPLEADLVYQTFGQLDLIARHAVIRNTGTDDITLEILKSATLNLPTPANHYRVTHYAGNWGAEFGQQQCKLTQAQIVLENHRGTCAAHQHIPFVALDPESQATETTGQVFFAALKWSGDFKITVEQEFKGSVSIAAGINDFDSNWILHPGEAFATPATLLRLLKLRIRTNDRNPLRLAIRFPRATPKGIPHQADHLQFLVPIRVQD